MIGESVPKLISQLKLNTQNQKMECLHKIEIEKEEIKQALNEKEREKEDLRQKLDSLQNLKNENEILKNKANKVYVYMIAGIVVGIALASIILKS